MTRIGNSGPIVLLCGVLTACSGSSSAVTSAPSVAAGGTSSAITAADLRTRLYTYADDSMMGRESGKRGNFMATTYIADQAAKIGLEPGGENGGFFQVLPLVTRHLDPATSFTVAGTALELWKDYVPLPPVEGLPVARAGSLDGLAAVYGGRMGDSVITLSPEAGKGKLVVLGSALDPKGQPTFNLSIGSLVRFSGAGAIAIANWDLAPPQVTEFLKHEEAEVKEEAAGEGPKPLVLFITQATAERLLGKPLTNLQPGASGAAVSGEVRYIEKSSEAEARNVIGILRGSDPVLRTEYVAIGAHNDHIGMTQEPVDADSIWAFNKVMRPEGAEDEPGQPSPEQASRIKALLDSARKVNPKARVDSVYNGADDDGSGSVSVLEIAQYLASKPHPKRSILFVWHTGEEEGLWGSDWFTRHATVPRDSIVAQLNIDMVGRGDAGDAKGGGPGYLQLIGSRRLSTELGDLVETTNTTGKHGFKFDYSLDANGHPQNIYCRSDHAMYARFGIPIVFFTTGGHSDYHMLSDEPQRIDYPKLARVASLIADIATRTANLDHRVVVDKPKPDPEAPCQQ